MNSFMRICLALHATVNMNVESDVISDLMMFRRPELIYQRPCLLGSLFHMGVQTLIGTRHS